MSRRKRIRPNNKYAQKLARWQRENRCLIHGEKNPCLECAASEAITASLLSVLRKGIIITEKKK